MAWVQTEGKLWDVELYPPVIKHIKHGNGNPSLMISKAVHLDKNIWDFPKLPPLTNPPQYGGILVTRPTLSAGLGGLDLWLLRSHKESKPPKAVHQIEELRKILSGELE